MSLITKDIIYQGLSYSEYRKLIDDLLKQNKTTGNNHDAELLEYTKLNVYRMHRIDTKIKLHDLLVDKLHKLVNSYVWLVITEAWCGDAAQNLPIIAKMKYVSPAIDLRIILRDEHRDIMNNYLTNGSLSVPKLICINAETMEELFVWGPRPEPAQKIVMDNKNAAEPLDKKAIAEKLHLWYAQDKCDSLQQELFDLIEKFMS